ncbi:hypothetical protein T12_8454 [Trichinella patagoniensis]|uniref:Uncharacterized protein n=2 Tax=Trichinella patagoniensis TaxID=990121 RepID=A0A0V1AAQ7_9BILA|nr:hypothetical protein T12_8454 [Trichinella patagoniensis]
MENTLNAAQLIMYKCYYDRENSLEDISQLYSTLLIAWNLLRSLLLSLKLYQRAIFLAISRQIRIHETFWKVLRHINAYVSNKWPLKFPCAYLNTQGSCTTGTPLIRIQGNIFTIIMRYSFTLRSVVQYFVVLGNSIFLHFRTILNKLKKVVSLPFEMCIKS